MAIGKDYEGGTPTDYTPQNAVPMLTQQQLIQMASENPWLAGMTPEQYYNQLFGGGSVVPSSNPTQDSSMYFAPTSGNINQTPGQSANWNPADTSFLGMPGYMAPLSVLGIGALAGGFGGAAAGGAASTAADVPWYQGLTDAAGGSLASPGAAGAAYTGLGDVAGGALAGGVGTAANGVSSASSLSKLLDGSASTSDYAKILGTLGATGLGVYGANQQQNAYSDVANKYLGLGQPFRDKLLASYDPSFDISKEPGYKNALDTGLSTFMRAASAGKAGQSSGNPFDNPGVSTEAMKYIDGNLAIPYLNTYRSSLATSGGLGTNTAGTADLGGATTSGQGLNALGYGLNQITNPQPSLADLLAKYNTPTSFNYGSGF